MGGLQNFLDHVLHKEKLSGIASLTNIDGQVSFHSSGSFSKGNEKISLSTQFPLGNLMEIFISAYFTLKMDDYGLKLDDSIEKFLKGLKIKQERASFIFLQLQHLLGHTAGFAKYRNVWDYMKGRNSHIVSSEEDMIPLVEYFSIPINRLETPGNVFVQNDIDYALIAVILESILKSDFKSQITEFLKEIDPSALPYDFNFEPGFRQSGSNRKTMRKLDKEYHNLYPSTMGSLNFSQFSNILFSLLFDYIHHDYLQYYLLETHLSTIPLADKVGLPLRYREDIGIYQLNSQIQGYTLSLIIQPEKKLISLVVISLDSPDSQFLAGKLQRKILEMTQIMKPPTYDLDHDLSLSDNEVAAITDIYKIYEKPSLITSLYDNQLGVEFRIRNKGKELYMSTLIDGIFYNSSRYSYRYNLKILKRINNKVVLGFDDGFYYSKIIIPDSTKAANLYMELDHGPTLVRIDRPNRWIKDRVLVRNFYQNLGFLIFFSFIPKIRPILKDMLMAIGISKRVPSSTKSKRTDRKLFMSKLSGRNVRSNPETFGDNDSSSTSISQEKAKPSDVLSEDISEQSTSYLDKIFGVTKSIWVFFNPFYYHLVRSIMSLPRLFLGIFMNIWKWIRAIPDYITSLRENISSFIDKVQEDNKKFPPKLTRDKTGLVNLLSFTDHKIKSKLKPFSIRKISLRDYYQYSKDFVVYRFSRSRFNQFNIKSREPKGLLSKNQINNNLKPSGGIFTEVNQYK